jgi:hypothetical protein
MRIFGTDGSARIYADRRSKADNGDYFPLSQTRQLENKLNGAREFPSPDEFPPLAQVEETMQVITLLYSCLWILHVTRSHSGLPLCVYVFDFGWGST